MYLLEKNVYFENAFFIFPIIFHENPFRKQMTENDMKRFSFSKNRKDIESHDSYHSVCINLSASIGIQAAIGRFVKFV